MTAHANERSELRKRQRNIERDLRVVRDPWVRRDLYRRLRSIRDRLARL